MAKSNAGRKPLPTDQKKNTENVFLTTPQKGALIKKYGSLTKAILTVKVDLAFWTDDV